MLSIKLDFILLAASAYFFAAANACSSQQIFSSVQATASRPSQSLLGSCGWMGGNLFPRDTGGTDPSIIGTLVCMSPPSEAARAPAPALGGVSVAGSRGVSTCTASESRGVTRAVVLPRLVRFCRVVSTVAWISSALLRMSGHALIRK